MAPPSWTTHEQWQWLCERKGAAADARKRGRYGSWFTSLCHDWFLWWPERQVLFPDIGHADPLTAEQAEELATAVKKRKLQLGVWFQNHKSRSRATNSLPSAVLAELSKGKGRAPQAHEVFCRLFYDDEKKALVENDLQAQRDALGRKLERAETLAITRRRIDALFEAASNEVKAQVDAKMAEEKAMKSAALTVSSPEEVRTPLEYQRSIESGPNTLQRLIDPVSQQMGWTICLVGAGPSPEEGGAIRSFAMHFGKTPSGHTLAQAFPDFRENYIRPMIQFAQTVYPPEVRQSRALRIATADHDATVDDPGTIDASGSGSSKPDVSPRSPPLASSPSQPPTPPLPSVASPSSSVSGYVTAQHDTSQHVTSQPAATGVASFGADALTEFALPGDAPFSFSELLSFPTTWQTLDGFSGQNLYDSYDFSADLYAPADHHFGAAMNGSNAFMIPPNPMPLVTDDPLLATTLPSSAAVLPTPALPMPEAPTITAAVVPASAPITAVTSVPAPAPASAPAPITIVAPAPTPASASALTTAVVIAHAPTAAVPTAAVLAATTAPPATPVPVPAQTTAVTTGTVPAPTSVGTTAPACASTSLAPILFATDPVVTAAISVVPVSAPAPTTAVITAPAPTSTSATPSTTVSVVMSPQPDAQPTVLGPLPLSRPTRNRKALRRPDASPVRAASGKAKKANDSPKRPFPGKENIPPVKRARHTGL
ncbi:hypothetical protein C8Q76DRAFT_693823 [Earliella scabrosa]|nr:hypothetical protein C8Q76DRAFT_693823 [Earliella scabrosa]